MLALFRTLIQEQLLCWVSSITRDRLIKLLYHNSKLFELVALDILYISDQMREVYNLLGEASDADQDRRRLTRYIF